MTEKMWKIAVSRGFLSSMRVGVAGMGIGNLILPGSPTPKKMADELHALGYRVLLWGIPYVCADGMQFVRFLRPLAGTDPETAEHLYMRNEADEAARVHRFLAFKIWRRWKKRFISRRGCGRTNRARATLGIPRQRWPRRWKGCCGLGGLSPENNF